MIDNSSTSNTIKIEICNDIITQKIKIINGNENKILILKNDFQPQIIKFIFPQNSIFTNQLYFSEFFHYLNTILQIIQKKLQI